MLGVPARLEAERIVPADLLRPHRPERLDAAGLSCFTFLTVRFTVPGAPTRYATAGSATARSRFAPGPAKMTAIRFHVRCRQYASLSSPSRSSVSPRRALLSAPG